MKKVMHSGSSMNFKFTHSRPHSDTVYSFYLLSEVISFCLDDSVELVDSDIVRLFSVLKRICSG